MNKQEEKLRALQMTLEELDNTIQVTKFEKKRKVELENGLFLDPKIYDLRNVEDFNLRFERNLAIFKAQNPTKTTREFINNEIEKINNIEAEIKRIWSLSEYEYYNELSTDKEIIAFKKFYLNEYKDTTEEEIKSIILRNRPRTKPTDFEDYRITLYKQKLNELPIKTDNFKHIYDDSIFKNNNAFLIFTEFINNDVPDPLTDFSFIFQNLKKDNLIHSLKHKEFYNWLLEKEFITNRDYCIIDNNNGFKSLSKCFSSKRSNKYIRLKEKYL